MDWLLALLANMGPTHWMVLGLVLLIFELTSGTTLLLWPAVAAFIVALVAWTGLTSWTQDMALFAVLVIALTAFGRPLVMRWRREGAANGLNERAQTLIGAQGRLISFADGVGSVKVNDTVWRAVSEETLEAGEHVLVASVDGATLKVKRIS